jgi:hypothetical protein
MGRCAAEGGQDPQWILSTERISSVPRILSPEQTAGLKEQFETTTVWVNPGYRIEMSAAGMIEMRRSSGVATVTLNRPDLPPIAVMLCTEVALTGQGARAIRRSTLNEKPALLFNAKDQEGHSGICGKAKPRFEADR